MITLTRHRFLQCSLGKMLSSIVSKVLHWIEHSEFSQTSRNWQYCHEAFPDTSSRIRIWIYNLWTSNPILLTLSLFDKVDNNGINANFALPCVCSFSSLFVY